MQDEITPIIQNLINLLDDIYPDHTGMYNYNVLEHHAIEIRELV